MKDWTSPPNNDINSPEWIEWAQNRCRTGSVEPGTPEPDTANTSTPEQHYMIPLPTDEDARKCQAEREARLAQSYGDTSTPSNLPPLATMEAENNGDTSTIEATEQSNFFICKSANQWIQEAKQRPNPEPLYMTLWFQGEHCCLFADSNIGKSVLAVQIATAIEPNRMVLLFDFELSDKMFQMRYTDDETQQLYDFPPNLLRLELNPESKDIITANLEDAIIKNIELAAISKNAQIIIIDNLTWLSNQLEKGDAAGDAVDELGAEILGPEIHPAAQAGAEEIAGVVKKLRRDQQEIAVVQIVDRVLHKKAAGAVLDTGQLIIGVAVVMTHQIARVARTSVHIDAGDAAGACSGVVFHDRPPEDARAEKRTAFPGRAGDAICGIALVEKTVKLIKCRS